jgi:uncharacterized damage-inducible protein DinB
MLNTPFTRELPHEAASTNKFLQILPFEKWTWKPHEKSMTLGMLATHIAEIPGWITSTLQSEELDLGNWKREIPEFKDAEELVHFHDQNVAAALAALSGASDEMMRADWTMRHGSQVLVKMARIGVIRGLAMNHMIHHRGQLSVYLRLLDVPIPGMYGPSADERNF